MHRFDEETGQLWQQAIDLAYQRRHAPQPLNGPKPAQLLQPLLQDSITAQGLGGNAALNLFAEVIVPATVTGDHERFFAFIGHAPTEASVIGDLLLGAFPIFGGDWIEGAGAIQAENEVLTWMARLGGLPDGAGGCFVSGGTIGNVSALFAARQIMARRRGNRPDRWALVASTDAHSSVQTAADVLDVDVIPVPIEPGGKLTGDGVAKALQKAGDRVFAVVASAGSTNLGIIDDLASIGSVCRDAGVWLHVDGSYGLAGMASPKHRAVFDGIELADSFIVDPHKWFFSTYDCCALLYRNPAEVRESLAQKAAYLVALEESEDWHPADYAIHLSRRARGIPVWFSLAVNGWSAYAEAIDTTMAVTKAGALAVKQRPYLELIQEPELTVLAFRVPGWTQEELGQWANQLLADGVAFVTPSSLAGEPIVRLSIVHPLTTLSDIEVVLDSLAEERSNDQQD